MTPGGLEDSLRSTTSVLVVGNESAVGVATHLGDDHDVRLVSDDDEAVRTATARGLDASRTDVTDGGRLRDHVDSAEAAVVATERDRANLLVVQLLRTVCGVDDVVVQVNDPENVDVFDGLDVDVVVGSSLVASEVADALFDD